MKQREVDQFKAQGFIMSEKDHDLMIRRMVASSVVRPTSPEWAKALTESPHLQPKSDRIDALLRRRDRRARVLKLLSVVLALAGAGLVLSGVIQHAAPGLMGGWTPAFQIAGGGICLQAALWEWVGAQR